MTDSEVWQRIAAANECTFIGFAETVRGKVPAFNTQDGATFYLTHGETVGQTVERIKQKFKEQPCKP